MDDGPRPKMCPGTRQGGVRVKVEKEKCASGGADKGKQEARVGANQTKEEGRIPPFAGLELLQQAGVSGGQGHV